MRIKELKISGFKSFVLPTSIPFPSHLVGVVGPNGCGKSNIIDAVRWVMGESSAKSLRGDSMIDVIFNGSTTRKALGVASVELVFDNSLGRIGGEFASYKEVSVKRSVSRDGSSNYYLNGSRCRRKDINDIFLGTGAGARGYAIIGQDMIAKIIDARPEVLKSYLEEACGVSKYKERRKETITRIEDTKDNLIRVADIREELDKQLAKLKNQALKAKKYKELKEESRRQKAILLSYQWQEAKAQSNIIHEAIANFKTQKLQSESLLTTVKNEIVVEENRYQEQQCEIDNSQNNYFKTGQEITKIEARIAQDTNDRARLVSDKQELVAQCESLCAAKNELEKKEAILLGEYKTMQKQQEQIALDVSSKKKLLVTLEQNHQNSLAEIQELQEAFNEKQRNYERERLQSEHLQSQKDQKLTEIENIGDKLAQINEVDKTRELGIAKKESSEIEKQLDKLQQISNTLKTANRDVINKQKKLEQVLFSAQKNQEKCLTQKTKLDAKLNALLKHNEKKEEHIDDCKLLIDMCNVEKKWQRAFETVYAELIQGKLVENINNLLTHNKASQGIYLTYTNSAHCRPKKRATLLDKITGAIPRSFINLRNIYLADDIASALNMLGELQACESVITEDGIWFNNEWFINNQQADKDRIFSLKEESHIAKIEFIKAKADCDAVKINLAFAREIYESQNRLMESINALIKYLSNVKTNKNSNINKLEFTLEQERKSNMHLTLAKEDLFVQIEELSQELYEKDLLCENLLQESQEYERKHQDKKIKYADIEKELTTARESFAQIQKNAHKIELELKEKSFAWEKTKEEVAKTITEYEKKTQKIKQISEKLEAPREDFQQQLESLIAKYQKIEEFLAKQKEEHYECEVSKRNLIKQQEDLREKIKAIDARLNEEKIKLNNSNFKLESLASSREELVNYVQSEEKIIDARDAELAEKKQAQIEHKLLQLGNVNFVAIDEYEQEKSRKENIEKQSQDLEEALQTLELAIEKMDFETQSRLNDTFSEVNSFFQSLFPRLFGGGSAKLVPTCDNLLTAGIQVMVHPPGKKNSTIQMLSGGEKAMTAVALVFSIFQLNPAPFCMLDEVDAPLDDANIGRFCDLVRDMSETVQFLFITHNKVTMELADHLIGVTMREPGVSRIVAVDVEEVMQ